MIIQLKPSKIVWPENMPLPPSTISENEYKLNQWATMQDVQRKWRGLDEKKNE